MESDFGQLYNNIFSIIDESVSSQKKISQYSSHLLKVMRPLTEFYPVVDNDLIEKMALNIFFIVEVSN